MAATHFQAHRPSHLPTLRVVDPATGQGRSHAPIEAALRVETFGPLVVVTATYVFEPVPGEGHCRMTFPERARVYRAAVGGNAAALMSGKAAGVSGAHEGDAFVLRWSAQPEAAPLSIELAWVQEATQDGLGWSTHLPVAERVAYRAHQAEEAAGNGTGWRTEGDWLVAEGAMRPFTLFWWPERDETAPRLHLYACGAAGLAVLAPPRRPGATLPRDVRVLLAVSDDSLVTAQRVAQSIRAGLGEQDTWRLSTLDGGPGLDEPAAPARCVQTLVVTDASGPRLVELLKALPAARVIALDASVTDAHLHLDPAASWSRNQADLEAFLAPMESVCARDLVVRSRSGDVLAVLGELAAIGLSWQMLAGVDGPSELVTSDGHSSAKVSPVPMPHEAAWTAFEGLVSPG